MADGTTTFEVGGVPFAVDRHEDTWTVVLRRSLVQVRDEAEVDRITHDEDGLMRCRVTWTQDSVTLLLTSGPGAVAWAEVARGTRADRLRALVNVGETARLVDKGYAVLLHPDNLVVDRNLRPRLGYRGLAGAMPPEGGREHFLRQYQALVLSTFDAKASFGELMDGAMTLRRATELERTVLTTSSVDDLVTYLTELYDTTTTADSARLVRVSRRAHLVFRHCAVWLGVLAVAAGAATGYYAFVRMPFEERLLTADTHFVKRDYEGVIETLRPVAVERLPPTQRYELASSYLRGTNLSEEQKTAIGNTLSLSAEPAALTYWVQVGRGQLDGALDTAKGLNDVDLVLYALTLLQEQVASDTGMSGTERQTRLAELQSEYDSALEVRSAAVEQGAAVLETTGPTPAASEG